MTVQEENYLWALSLFGDSDTISVHVLYTDTFKNNLNKYEDAITFLSEMTRHGFVGQGKLTDNSSTFILYDRGKELYEKLKTKKATENWRQTKQDKKLEVDLEKSQWDNRIKVVGFVFLLLGAIWSLIQIIDFLLGKACPVLNQM